MIKLSNSQTVSISTGTIVAGGTFTTEAYNCHLTVGLFSLQSPVDSNWRRHNEGGGSF